MSASSDSASARPDANGAHGANPATDATDANTATAATGTHGANDVEEALFQAALQALSAGDLAAARRHFEAVVRLNGRRQTEARRYLDEIGQGPAKGLQKLSTPFEHETRSRDLAGARDLDALARDFDAVARDFDQTRRSDAPPPPPPGGDFFESVRAPASHAADWSSDPLPPPPSQQGPARAATLRRTPHMTLTPDGPPAPGAVLAVAVWADTGSFLPGEEGDEVVIENAPDEIVLEVWLVASEHFTMSGPAVQSLTLRRAEPRSPKVQFAVRLRDFPPAPTAPTLGAPAGAFLSALFAYRGRPCGRVTREVELAPARPATGTAETAATAETPAATKTPAAAPAAETATLSIETAAEPADLIVRIVAGSVSDGRVFECRVETHLLPAYAAGASEPWRLAALAPDVVASYMKLFTAKGITSQVRAIALRGAGIHLFDASPPLFRKVFWELVDARKLPRSIAIISEEPSFPWELMVPTRQTAREDEQREPLGAEFLVSRWTSRNQVHPVQHVTLKDCYVVAPTDSNLAMAPAEAKMVIGSFAPGKGSLIDPAGIVKLDATLSDAGRSLLHFVCHGKSGGAAGQTLELQNKEALNSSFLRAMPGVKKAFRAAKPVVFLNACEVGRAEPALVGVGGFAEAFMILGASAVIAPLWSVKDSIAHQVAVEFYARSGREPETPFAEILRDLRRRSYAQEGGEDSWAAYCFYGDPLATAGMLSP